MEGKLKNLLEGFSIEDINSPEGVTPVGCPRMIEKMFVLREGEEWCDVYDELVEQKAPEGANAYILGGRIIPHGEGWPIQYYRIEE